MENITIQNCLLDGNNRKHVISYLTINWNYLGAIATVGSFDAHYNTITNGVGQSDTVQRVLLKACCRDSQRIG